MFTFFCIELALVLVFGVADLFFGELQLFSEGEEFRFVLRP